jgi:hypothetical protein
MTYCTWDWIFQEVQNIEKLVHRYRDSIYPGTPLPSPYARALGCLEALLLALTEREARLTYSLLPFRPGFSAKWKFQYLQQMQTFATTPPVRKDIRDFIELFASDPLDFCLSSLAGTLFAQGEWTLTADKEYLWHEPSEFFAISFKGYEIGTENRDCKTGRDSLQLILEFVGVASNAFHGPSSPTTRVNISFP